MARLRDTLLAHGEQIDLLAEDLSSPGVSEAPALTLLFAGPPGVGKKTAALALAQILLCETKTGCGRCGSCLRAGKLAHESLLKIEPDGPQIKIDQAREVLEFLRLRGWGGSRVVIVDEAQSLNVQAANSLLKSLEEPPPGTVFILIAPSPSALLPTLRSRSRTLLFRPLSENELAKIEPTAPSWAVKASRGSAERLKALLDPAELELRQSAADLFESFLNDKDFLLPSSRWRDAVRERSAAARILGSWQAFIRDALLIQAGVPEQALNTDQKKLLGLLAKTRREGLEELSQKLFLREPEVAQFRDAQLVMEELWVSSRASLV